MNSEDAPGAMYDSLVAHVAATWPSHCIDAATGEMMGLKDGKSLRITTCRTGGVRITASPIDKVSFCSGSTGASDAPGSTGASDAPGSTGASDAPDAPRSTRKNSTSLDCAYRRLIFILLHPSSLFLTTSKRAAS
jgi:hypothetical protein